MARIVYLALIVLGALIISSILLQVGRPWLIIVVVLLTVFSIVMILRALPPTASIQDPQSKTSRYLGWFYIVGAAALVFLVPWRDPFQHRTFLLLAAAAFLIFARLRLARPPKRDSDED